MSDFLSVISAKSAEYTDPSITKSSKPSPSTSEAAGELKILLSPSRPSNLIDQRSSPAPPPSDPSFPSKA